MYTYIYVYMCKTYIYSTDICFFYDVTLMFRDIDDADVQTHFDVRPSW